MARYCFGLLYDRFKLSEKSVDEYRSDKFLGARTYRLCDLNPRKFPGDTRTNDHARGADCVYKQKDLAAEMGCTERTIRRCLDTLREAGLIETERAGFNGANRLFIPFSVQTVF